jgi:hypothetical protein
MKKLLASSVVLATMLASLASPALAAPPKYRAPVSHDTVLPYGQIGAERYARQPDVVTLGSRVVGEDPDPSIRTQLLHDPVPAEY